VNPNVLSGNASSPPKPRLRGVTHQYAFFISLVAGCALVWNSTGFKQTAINLVFALSVCLLFGISGLYHRIQWSPKGRQWMRRLDHSSIYLLISGTYTPLMVIALDQTTAYISLAIVWGASAVGIFVELCVPSTPKWLTALTYVAIGWVAVFFYGEIIAAIGGTAFMLILVGGIFYTIGAIVYTRKRPNPSPEVFGYHEIFHLLVIAGVVVHYFVIALLI